MRRKLGKMEMAEAISNEFYAFNAVIILRITNGPSEETLRILLPLLQRRQPLLGVHIHKEKNWFYYVSADTPGIPLKVVERQNNRHWQQVAEEELNTRFDLFTGPLVRFTYLTGPGSNESEIIITFQHSIMDAVSGGNLLHEILSFCREIESRGSVEGLNILGPLPPADAFFPPAFQGFRRKWNLFLFFLRQMRDEFRYRRRTRGKRVPPIHPTGKNKILPVKLSKKLTAALIKGSHQKRVTLNNLVTAAFLMAVHQHLYDGEEMPLRHINTTDLRPYLNPPLEAQYFGSYFAMMRFTVGMKKNPRVWELAREFGDISYFSLKRGDKFCTHQFSYRMMRMLFRLKSFRMGNTAMSFTGPVIMEKKYGKIEVRDIHGFASNFVLGPEYSSLVRLFDDHIYWDFLYLDSDMDHEKAAVIADEILKILESAVKE
jgi:hypothetical protein